MDLVQWRSHIDQVVSDEGQWVGVADENGYPIYELEGELTFPKQYLAAASAEITVAVQPGDRVLDDLVGDRLGETDSVGRLVPASGPTRLLLLVRPGERRAATITHAVASGQAAPSSLTIHAVDILDGLAWWPCPSIPGDGWERTHWEVWKEDAAGKKYEKPREMAALQFATKLLNYAKRGKSKTLLRILTQDSFDAVNRLYGWSDPHAVVEFGGRDSSGETAIRVNDDSVWDTIAEPARAAGLHVEVDLWWPGDDPVAVRADHDGTRTKMLTYQHPIQVVRINEIEEA